MTGGSRGKGRSGAAVEPLMKKNLLSGLLGRQTGADMVLALSLSAVAIFFVLSGILSYDRIRTLNTDFKQVQEAHETLLGLDELLSTLKDAETGQRGYILTGEESYLEPFNAAQTQVDAELTRLHGLVADTPEQLVRLARLRELINAKMAELNDTVILRRTKGFDAAMAVVKGDAGKVYMDQIRSQVASMSASETQDRVQRVAEAKTAYDITVWSVILAAAIGVVLSLVITGILVRVAAGRRRQEWLQAGQLGLTNAVTGEQRVDQLGRNVLAYLADYVQAQSGAFYVRDGNLFKRAATHGVPSDNDVPQQFALHEGLLGQAAASGAPMVLLDAPQSHLTIGASLGQWRPRHVLIVPARSDGVVDAIVELGFIHALGDDARDMVVSVAESINTAVRSANYRSSLQGLLEETQRQSEELQSQSEELRVNNEELEEQSRALKESHGRLEQQQAELETTNTQLEEQAQILEGQRDELNKTKVEIERKAAELEQASRYKSDFLANMSHELRTPLNSSLILAKLLADNPEGNLSEEQVKFARTILSSGNDLLVLINDILDLSKIEAGQMDIRPESVPLARLASDMARVFEPMAKQKGLDLTTTVDPALKPAMETDRQRLEQVLKNLMSNAVKFTETGTVALNITRAPGDRIAFAVTDTGIGISKDHQKAVFDAFRQADGTISRRYGGTGLGLSISRELARLLGGEITLASAPGKGSTFTLTVPVIYDPAGVAPRVEPLAAPVARTTAPAPFTALPSIPAVERKPARNTDAPPTPTFRLIADDREALSGGDKVILVVEDDAPFAGILYDLAHEQGFKCLVAANAEDALVVTRQYMPSAVVLDVGLPDHSGLSVLDQIKRDPKTRHIPVHVVSGNDYTHAALSMGAAGYMLKPVKREELVEAFKSLEFRLSQRMRRVLIVEDDPVQADSVAQLLKSQAIETVAVGTAAETLGYLKDQTFDCMVLDLTLPDASGYQLLETLSREEAYSFPPVIVYTGRDLSYDDEQKLRRYSKSIIIKGAKSPERLLDEVTLFLHQVVSDLSPEQQTLLKKAKSRDSMLEGRRILVVEDDVRNVYAVTNIFEPLGAIVQIARNGKEALTALEQSKADPDRAIDLVLMDVMMPEMDGLTATRELRKSPEWKKLPVIMLTAKAMKDDQEKCLDAGANDYLAKPLDVEKLVSLVRVWMPR
jgi:CheY-like chemotaxis protein/CHASE3 domain sensor protein